MSNTMNYLGSVAVAWIMFTSACSRAPVADPRIAALVEEVETLKIENHGQAKDIKELLERIAFPGLHGGVYLNVTEKSYALVDTNTGVLLVKIMGVQPYANGQQLTVGIGNPSTLTYVGFDIKAKWGRKWQGQVAYNVWQKQLREKTFTMTESLRACKEISVATKTFPSYTVFRWRTRNRLRDGLPYWPLRWTSGCAACSPPPRASLSVMVAPRWCHGRRVCRGAPSMPESKS